MVNEAFGIVIRTQEEFDRLISSEDWFGVHSVLFVGDGGNKKFIRSDGQGILVPQSVFKLQGTDDAIIEVTNYRHNSGPTAVAALWLKSREETTRYSIRDLTINCSGEDTVIYGLHNFQNVIRCRVNIRVTNSGQHSAGFVLCSNLTECTSHVIGGDSYAFQYCYHAANCNAGESDINSPDLPNYGFVSCSHLTNSTATAKKIGFSECVELTSCATVVKGEPAFGYHNCRKINGCTALAIGTNDVDGSLITSAGFNLCHGLSNCYGTATALATNKGYGFCDCEYLSNCKQSDAASTTAFLGGTNTKVDSETVVAS